MSTIRPWVLWSIVVCLLLPVRAAAQTGDRSESDPPPSPNRPVERILVFSMPATSFADIDAERTPHLDRFLDGAAIADLSVRAVSRRTSPTDGYTTLGAGTRSVGSGSALAAYEAGADAEHEAEYTRRTGVVPAPGEIFNPGVVQVTRANDRLDYGSEVGALGARLAEAGVPRSVIANADHLVAGEIEPFRSATLALIDPDGIVPAGRIGPELLAPDPAAPYGVRLDVAEVRAAAHDALVEGGVVLVEASDIARFDAYRSLASTRQRQVLRDDALRSSDELFGQLLTEVDLERDAVLVVGPYHRGGQPHLTIAALQAPGIEPGLLQSGTTRRPGFVTLADVAPTILALLDLNRPRSMEGRPWERVSSGGSPDERRAFLEEADAMARFRDDNVAPASAWYIVGHLLLWVLAAVSLRWGARREAAIVEVLALASIGFLPATYLATLLPFHDAARGWWWPFLAAVSLAFGIVTWTLGRRNPVDSLLVALGALVVFLMVDVMVGAPLQLNAVFGYSPTVAGRFAGYGNLAFAQLAAAAVMLAALVAHRIGGRRGIVAAAAILCWVVVLDGAPFWGSDVGGVLALVPATGTTLWLLLGRRLRARTIVIWGVVAVGLVLVFGLIDLTRPEDARTHLGRLLEDISNDGFEPFRDVVLRKLEANIRVLTSNVWTLMVPVVLAFIGYLYWRAPGALRRVGEDIPAERAALGGLGVVMLLGFALNDSGIAVPGVMLGVVNASLVFLLMRTNEPPTPPGSSAAAAGDAGQQAMAGHAPTGAHSAPGHGPSRDDPASLRHDVVGTGPTVQGR